MVEHRANQESLESISSLAGLWPGDDLTTVSRRSARKEGRCLECEISACPDIQNLGDCREGKPFLPG
jgi:hypothetical protein